MKQRGRGQEFRRNRERQEHLDQRAVRLLVKAAAAMSEPETSSRAWAMVWAADALRCIAAGDARGGVRATARNILRERLPGAPGPYSDA